MDSEEEFWRHLGGCHVAVDEQQGALLFRYFGLLCQWNERLNLTRHTAAERFVARDVVDSRALAAWIDPGRRVLDVGTGGGVPGLVMAILRPDLSVAVCESVGKKARAVEAIVKEIPLPVAVHHARGEELLAAESFDTLVARAVAPLPKLLHWFAPCHAAFDRLLVVKGPRWKDEWDQVQASADITRSFSLQVMTTYRTPGTDALNVILQFKTNRASRRTR